VLNDRIQLRGIVVLVISDGQHSELQLTEALDAQCCIIRSSGSGGGVDLERPCDVAVITVRQQQGWTAGVIAALRGPRSICATLMLLSTGGPDDIAQSLRDGAVDCLVNPISTEALIEGVSNALACTQRWRRRVADANMTRSSHTTLIAAARNNTFEPVRRREPASQPTQAVETVVDHLSDQGQLTVREREVLYWLLQGHRYDDIATVLGVTSRTVKFHAANLLRKLDLDSRHDLTRIVAQGF
jgi:DNA-binding NarL/FixJ family response regulator